MSLAVFKCLVHMNLDLVWDNSFGAHQSRRNRILPATPTVVRIEKPKLQPGATQWNCTCLCM